MSFKRLQDNENTGFPLGPENVAVSSTSFSAKTVWFMAVLEIVAIGLSSYLLWLVLAGGVSPAGCGGGSVVACDHVLASRWSRLLHLPVALPALVLYIGLFTATVSVSPGNSPRVRRAAWPVVVALVTVAAGMAVWFIGLQLIAIGSVCPFCMCAHACALVLMGTVLVHAPRSRANGLPPIVATRQGPNVPIMSPAAVPGSDPSARSSYRRALLAGGIVAGMVVLVQTMTEPDLSVVTLDLAAGEDPAGEDPASEDPASDTVGLAGAAGTGDQPYGNDSNRDKPPLAGEPVGNGPDTSSNASSGNRSIERLGPPAKPARTVPPGQLEGPRRAPLTESVAGGPVERPRPSEARTEPRTDNTVATGPAGPPVVKILGGKIKLRVADEIVLDGSDAEAYIVELFDYTCPHCRRMHFTLKTVRKRYRGRLGMILIPVPLNPGCNPAVKQTHQDHAYACMYARLAMAVWQHNRAAFPGFHDWLFESVEPPPAGIAQHRARKLISDRQLFDALNDPWVDRHLTQCVKIYQRYRAGTIPKIVIGKHLLTGKSQPEKLFELIDRSFEIQPAVGSGQPTGDLAPD